MGSDQKWVFYIIKYFILYYMTKKIYILYKYEYNMIQYFPCDYIILYIDVQTPNLIILSLIIICDDYRTCTCDVISRCSQTKKKLSWIEINNEIIKSSYLVSHQN